MSHPELEGPYESGSVYGERRRRMLRIAVLVGLGALVLPLVLSAFAVARSGAARACAVYSSQFDSDAAGQRVEFDLFGPGGPGWQCFAVSAGGDLVRLGNLGLMPAAPRAL